MLKLKSTQIHRPHEKETWELYLRYSLTFPAVQFTVYSTDINILPVHSHELEAKYLIIIKFKYILAFMNNPIGCPNMTIERQILKNMFFLKLSSFLENEKHKKGEHILKKAGRGVS